MKTSRIAWLLVLVLMSSAQVVRADEAAGVGVGMEPVAEIPYDNGTHLAVTRIEGRDYAIASAGAFSGSPDGAVRVIDVTNPRRPKVVGTVACSANQSHLQVSHDRKTLIVGEDGTHRPDACGAGGLGFFTIDISNPRSPEPIGVADVPRGAHTTTTHPTKPIVFVSYGDVVATQQAAFEVWSIKDPAKPKRVATVPVTGYHGPHDISFNAEGTRAVAASISTIHVLDTTDPGDPKELAVLQCPGCSHNHEARFTPDEKHVVVSDETPSPLTPCPMGGLYFYEWTADAEPYMTLVGQWQPREIITPSGAPTNAGLCTSHVFGISPDGTKVAASWHTAGVRVVDISSLTGVGVGDQGTGPREVAWYLPDGSDAFSAKFDPSGRFVFVNDLQRGFSVYELTAES
ncbi:MAG: lactonase family protein [Actinomycetota bacterium]|nr:lactonase family protein [Actinomycetota bacterium]